MFSFFKKKDTTPKSQVPVESYLPETINVDNLKDYVVRGFELEKELKAEIEQLKSFKAELMEKVEENEIQAVVLSDYKYKISRLERDIDHSVKQENKLKEKLSETESSLNDYIILAKKGESEYEKGFEEGKERYALIATELITNHKSNLSKQQAIEYLKEATCAYLE